MKIRVYPKQTLLVILLLSNLLPVFATTELLWYKMNEGTGSSVVNYGTTGGAGAITGAVWEATPSVTPFSQWLKFDGTDDKIQSANNLGITGNTARCVTFWTRDIANVNYDRLFCMGGTSNNQGFQLYTHHTDTKYHASAEGLAVDWNTQIAEGTNLKLFGLCWSGSAVHVWVNNTIKYTNASIPNLATTDAVLKIAIYCDGSTQAYNGYINDMRVFTSNLSVAEMSYLWNGGLGRTCSLSEYPFACGFDNFNATLITDNSTYKNEHVYDYNSSIPLTFCAYNTTGIAYNMLNISIPAWNVQKNLTYNLTSKCYDTIITDVSNYTVFNVTAVIQNFYNPLVNITPLFISIREPNFLYYIWKNVNTLSNTVTNGFNSLTISINNMACALKLYSAEDTISNCQSYYEGIGQDMFNSTLTSQIGGFIMSGAVTYFNDSLNAPSQTTNLCNLNLTKYTDEFESLTPYYMINYPYGVIHIGIDQTVCFISLMFDSAKVVTADLII